LGLPDGEEIMPLAFFVLTQYRRVTDGQTDGQTDRQTDGHVAIAITRASIASRGEKAVSSSLLQCKHVWVAQVDELYRKMLKF